MPPQNSGHHVLEGEATLTQFNRPVLFSDHVLRLRKLELKGFHICGDVVIILKKYRSFLWLFGGLVFAGPLSGGRFLSASLLIIIIIITVLSPHPIKLLCMKTAGVKLHVLTVVFMQSQLVYSVPPAAGLSLIT